MNWEAQQTAWLRLLRKHVVFITLLTTIDISGINTPVMLRNWTSSRLNRVRKLYDMRQYLSREWWYLPTWKVMIIIDTNETWWARCLSWCAPVTYDSSINEREEGNAINVWKYSGSGDIEYWRWCSDHIGYWSTKCLFWSLFPILVHISGNIHINKPFVDVYKQLTTDSKHYPYFLRNPSQPIHNCHVT